MKKTCLILALLIVLASAVPVYATGTSFVTGQVDFAAPAPEGYKLIASNTPVYAIQFWHYSGGYWANSLYGIRFDDEDVAYVLTKDAEMLRFFSV